LALLLGLIVLIVIIIMIIGALRSGSSDKPAAEAPKPSPTVSEEATDSVAPCKGKDLEIVLSSTKEQFATGDVVELVATVTNNGPRNCTITPDARTVELEVVSGTDQIFHTAHCADQIPAPSPEATVEIQAGASEDLPITWTAERSLDRCQDVADKDQPHRARDATYRATVTISGMTSDETSFLLVP